MTALDPITGVANVVDDVLHSVLPDPQAQAQARNALAQMVINGRIAQMTSQAGIITAEADSQSWLTRSWRPITMLVFVAIIANNYLIAPYLQVMFHAGLQLALPPDMWDLLKLGIGGYVVGRTVEKTTTAITGRSPTAALTNAATSVANIFKGA